VTNVDETMDSVIEIEEKSSSSEGKDKEGEEVKDDQLQEMKGSINPNDDEAEDDLEEKEETL